jgi:hypothetical protein
MAEIANKFITGQVTIETANKIKVIIPSGTNTTFIKVKANDGNSGLVYLGDEGVTSTTGFELGAGDDINLDINVNKKPLYVTGNTANDKISFIAFIKD